MPERPSRVVAEDSETEAEALLDELFDQALSACERGEDLELEPLLAGRPDLRDRAEEAVRLAREVAVNTPRKALPVREVAGYELEREIGAGAMGTVFLARQRSLGGRRVALKVLPPSLGLSAGGRERFLSEARALAKLDHPGVVGVHDVIESDGIVAYAMEWIPGGSLARLIGAWRVLDERDELATLAQDFGVLQGSAGPASVVTWIVRAFAELARALGAVHRAGLLHRDIKPANLLVGRGGVLLLSDFGLVRDSELSQHTRTGAVLGTLAYSAPEQLRAEQERIDVPSDLYSLGVSLHEALTLRLPFPATNAAERQRQAENGAIARPARRGVRLPRDLETILAKLLEPEPARRYASGDELAEDLEALLAFRPIRARPQGPGRRLLMFARRHRRTLVAAGGGLVVASALSLAVGWWLRMTPARIETLRRAAEVALLESGRIDGVSPYSWETRADPALVVPAEEEWLAKLEEVVRLYAEALALDPLDVLGQRLDLREERDVAALALALLRENQAVRELLERLEPSIPVTVRIARAGSLGRRELPDPETLAGCRPADRRALGLLGYLLGDTELAARAWADRPWTADPDLLADGALGVLHCYEERFHVASLRLKDALRLAPDSNYLCSQLAYCAVKLGEFQEAERLLQQAEHLTPENSYELTERVRADMLVAQGRRQEGLALYRSLGNHGGPVYLENYARAAELVGDWSTATNTRAGNAYQRPAVVEFHRRVLDSSERWWRSLGRIERWNVLLRLLSGDRRGTPAAVGPRGDYSLPEALLISLERYHTLPASRPGDSPPPRRWLPPSSGTGQARHTPSFLAVCRQFVASGAEDAELARLPAWIRHALLVLWYSALPFEWQVLITRGLLRIGLAEQGR
jgi:serine/threonine protein kinase